MEISEWMAKGGAFMWPILICAIVGATVALERAIYVWFRASIDARAFMASVQREVLDGNIEGALRLCNADPGAVLPRVAKAALVRADRPQAEVRAFVEEAQAEVFPMVNRRLALIAMIANVATLLGLLGTIQGLILSFHSVNETAADARSAALADGIAVAMYTTFFGLLVAIPMLVAHGLVAGKANLLLDEVDHAALKLVNLLDACRGPRGEDPSPSVGDTDPVAPSGRGASVVPFRGAPNHTPEGDGPAAG